MVKLPDVQDIRARDPRAVGQVPSFPGSSPVASALQGFGQAAQGLGDTILEKQRQNQERQERFNQSNRLLQFEQDWDNYYQERLQTVEPGAAGFSASLGKDFDPRARKFMEGVPPELRPEIQQRLIRLGYSIRGRAQAWEREEAKRYSVEQGVNSEDTLLLRARQDPAQWRAIEGEGAALWDNNTNIDNIERAKQKERWEERRAIAELAELREMDPKAARDALLPQADSPADPASLIRQFEGFKSSAYWDVNANRAGYGSDTVTPASGAVQRVTKDTVVSREDAERDLQRRIGEFQGGIVRAVGEDAWNGLNQNQQAALTSVAYNYGELPQSVAAAVKAGDAEGIAQSIEGLAGHNGGVNAKRRMTEANVARGAGTALDPRFAGLDFEKRMTLLRQAEAAIDEQRRKYLEDIGDYTEFLRAGNPEAESGRYSPEDLIENLGPEDAAIVQREIDKAEAFGADVKADKWATPEERRVIFDARRAMLDSPEDFQENTRNLGHLMQAMEQRDTALKADPARYVQEDETVAKAYEAMQAAEGEELPEASRAYANAALALQQRLGLPDDMRRVLTKADADAIGKAYNDQVAGGQKSVDVVRGIAVQWGDQWPQVIGELNEQLPGPTMVIASMVRPDGSIRPGQMRAAEQLAEAAEAGKPALEGAMLEETAKTIKDTLEDAHGSFLGMRTSTGAGGTLQDFWRTLRAQPQGDATGTFATVKESVHLLALSYAAQGDTAEKAVERAVEDIIGKSYGFSDGGTFRVPVEYSLDAVERGAARALDNFDAAAVDLPDSAAGLPDEDTRAAYRSQIRANGFWVTNEDETGLALFDEQGAAVTAGGEPVRLTWEQLQESGAPMPWLPRLMMPGLGTLP